MAEALEMRLSLDPPKVLGSHRSLDCTETIDIIFPLGGYNVYIYIYNKTTHKRG